MDRRKGLAMLMLAGLLTLLAPGSSAWAQGGSGLTEQQRREMEQKYQEEWQFREQLNKEQEDTGARLEKGVQRRQDAERRQRQAEKLLREQEQEPAGGETE